MHAPLFRHQPWRIGLGLGLVAVAVAVRTAPGQPASRRVGVGRAALGAAAAVARSQPVDGFADIPSPQRPLVGRDSAWWVPLSSTLVPGLGQMRLGQGRFVAYLAVEAFAIIGYARGEAAVRRERQRYEGLAREIARAFVPGNTIIGDWAYYEALEKYIESGVFDRSPGAASLEPESDVETYNGSVWLKARQLSDWADPNVEPPHSSAAYQAAISYYVTRAVGPEFRWSWRNAQLEWDVYRQSIRRKNDASREASQYLAVVALNHLLSTVDAFVTLRLRGGLGAGKSGYRVTASLPLP